MISVSGSAKKLPLPKEYREIFRQFGLTVDLHSNFECKNNHERQTAQDINSKKQMYSTKEYE